MPKITFRQKQILDLLQAHGQISVKLLQAQLGLAPATAYREVNRLIAAGYALRTTGGMAMAGPAVAGPAQAVMMPGPAAPGGFSPPAACLHCGMAVNPRTQVILQLENGERTQACCPHCGLMAVCDDCPVTSALAADFIYGRMTNLRQAWFVFESSVILCCSPSVLCFQTESEAGRFQQGFGGRAMNFDHARQALTEMMHMGGGQSRG